MITPSYQIIPTHNQGWDFSGDTQAAALETTLSGPGEEIQKDADLTFVDHVHSAA